MIMSLVLAILSGSWTDRESVLDTAEEESLAIEAEPLVLPGELDLTSSGCLSTDIEPLELAGCCPGDDGSAVPRAE